MEKSTADFLIRVDATVKSWLLERMKAQQTFNDVLHGIRDEVTLAELARKDKARRAK